ncbi:MAG: SDR family oxidoreductase [Mycobacteriales bacterium]
MPRPRTILLTGATGVVGTALLPALRQHDVVCLVHRSPPRSGRGVPGDVTRPGLGWDRETRSTLRREVDVVVHCAAATDFSAGPAQTALMNVAGTRHVAEFAVDAGARLHYLSTAFVARLDRPRADGGDARLDPRAYLESKLAAEDTVRQAGLAGTLVRPSVVIGDSRTGEMAAFQGLHGLALATLRNALPLVPLPAGSRIDMVTQDVLARSVAALVEADATGEFWITAGEHALTAERMVELTVRTGRALGLAVDAPRLVEPDMVERLVRPVFIEPLPLPVRRRFDDMLVLTALFAAADGFPSDLARVPGLQPMPAAELATAYARSVEFLARAKGLVEAGTGRAA